MKYFIFTLFFFASIQMNAQFNWDSKNWDKKSLGFGCDYGGSISKPVLIMQDALINKRFVEIRDSLKSKVTAYQFLAAFLLEHLSNKKEIELSSEELENIAKIKTSYKDVPVCSGCTYYVEEPLAILFNSENEIYISANNWFNRYYQKYYEKK